MFDFSGRTILLTGAGGGLGRQLTLELVEAGARVIATDLSQDRGDELKAFVAEGGGQTDLVRYWVADQSNSKTLVDRIKEIFAAEGDVDSVINNAAIYPSTPAADLPLEEYAGVLRVNAEGSVAWTTAALPGMKRLMFGRVINIASITFDLGFAGLSSYVASKGALIGLVRVWAREFGPYGVTVNAISPGAFQTDAERIHPDPAAYNQRVLDAQALKRRGTPADFAQLAKFLLSENAGFITGQNIRVDGGWVAR